MKKYTSAPIAEIVFCRDTLFPQIVAQIEALPEAERQAAFDRLKQVVAATTHFCAFQYEYSENPV